MKSNVTLTSRIPLVQKQLRLASQVVRKSALDVEAQAKLRAPVDTGFLRNSIHTEQSSDLRAEVIVGAEYGLYIEYGTSRMAAQPFLNPAVEFVRPAFEAACAALLKL